MVGTYDTGWEPLSVHRQLLCRWPPRFLLKKSEVQANIFRVFVDPPQHPQTVVRCMGLRDRRASYRRCRQKPSLHEPREHRVRHQKANRPSVRRCVRASGFEALPLQRRQQGPTTGRAGKRARPDGDQSVLQPVHQADFSMYMMLVALRIMMLVALRMLSKHTLLLFLSVAQKHPPM